MSPGALSYRPASRGGWFLVGGAFVTFAVSAGFMHSYAIFLVAFLEAFRWTRAETSLAFSVSQLVGGTTAPLVGALVDRLRPRRLGMLGGVLLTLGLVGHAYVDPLLPVGLLYRAVLS